MCARQTRANYSYGRKTMAKRGENVWHRKDGRWEARYVRGYNSGRAVYGYVYAKTYADVKQLQWEAIQRFGFGITEARSGEITFEVLAEHFMCQKKYLVKQSTLSCYRSKLDSRLKPYWGMLGIKNINSMAVSRYIDYLFTEYNLSAKTVKDLAALLEEILDFAYDNGMIEQKVRVAAPKVPRKDAATFSRDDQEKLVRFLLTDIDSYKFGVLLALMTGMRIGEVCALRRSAFDFRRAVISVSGTLQRIRGDSEQASATQVMLLSPKSDSSEREIPLPREFAKWARQFLTGYDTDDFVITGTNQYVEPRTYYKRYLRYLKACGLGQTGYTFHTLRHTFATEALRGGFDIKSLSEILGHSGVKITLERYIHPPIEQKKQEVEKFMKCHPLSTCLHEDEGETDEKADSAAGEEPGAL